VRIVRTPVLTRVALFQLLQNAMDATSVSGLRPRTRSLRARHRPQDAKSCCGCRCSLCALTAHEHGRAQQCGPMDRALKWVPYAVPVPTRAARTLREHPQSRHRFPHTQIRAGLWVSQFVPGLEKSAGKYDVCNFDKICDPDATLVDGMLIYWRCVRRATVCDPY
jgi:hypothetical protein